jgi:riboflavin synthase
MVTITQEQLKEFYVIKYQLKALDARKDALRQAILDLNGMKAEVETGPFVLRVTSYEEERVDTKALLEAVAKELGEEKAKALKAAAIKKNTKTLVDVNLREETTKKNGEKEP